MRAKATHGSYPLSLKSMLSNNGFRPESRVLATVCRALAAVAFTVATSVAITAPAQADPMTVCPPNQPSNWNGKPCFPQPCVPPYAPGIPPCFMPPPQIGPNGMPVTG